MPRECVNGLDIHYERFGAGSPLLMLHGFTGSVGAWQGIPERLGKAYNVVAVDIIGHGGTSSPPDPARYTIEYAVDDLLALLDRLEVDRLAVLGYSMGGRVALHLALAAPDRVTALILESAAPGIADPSERRARAERDERLARMIEEQGLEAFVDHWEAIPLFASQRNLSDEARRRQRELRLGQKPTGLANSLRGMGAGAMEPVVDRMSEYTMPVLYLAGEYDEKYQDIGRQITSSMPDATFRQIDGAGHTIHLERSEEYVEAVMGFMTTHDEQARASV